MRGVVAVVGKAGYIVYRGQAMFRVYKELGGSDRAR